MAEYVTTALHSQPLFQLTYLSLIIIMLLFWEGLLVWYIFFHPSTFNSYGPCILGTSYK